MNIKQGFLSAMNRSVREHNLGNLLSSLMFSIILLGEEEAGYMIFSVIANASPSDRFWIKLNSSYDPKNKTFKKPSNRLNRKTVHRLELLSLES